MSDDVPGPDSYPLGKVYSGGSHAIAAADWKAYAAATDDAEAAYDGAAPPMFHVRPFIRLMLEMAADPELAIDMLRLVHGEHAVRFHRLLLDGEQLEVKGTLEAVAVKPSGRIFTFGLEGTVDTDTVVSGTTSYFIRAANPPPRGPRKPAPELPPVTWSLPQHVTDDQALRYAAASGDDNPIHTDPATAKAAGLPGCILHGLCTMAFAQRDLVAHYAAGEPQRLKELAVRFAKPVFPGDTLTLDVWEGDAGAVRFQTRDGKGKAVLTQGRARFA